MNPVRFLFHAVAIRLGKVGIIDEKRGSRIADLAWPRFLTMFARQLYRVSDIAMVGLAVGPAAIAGLAIASIYWQFANAFSIGLAGGTISQVSQRFGANQFAQIDTIVKMTLLIGLAMMAPFVIMYFAFSHSLIGIIADDPQTIREGTAYLQILGVALLFNVANHVFSRTLAGADDTVIAMATRATGAVVNIVLNAILIFGFGLGVQGAAIGTVIAEAIVTVMLAWGFLVGGLPILGSFPVTVTISKPYVDLDVAKELGAIAPPLVFDRLARSFARYPLFAILALFGPVTIAAYEVGRRIRMLMEASSKGFSMAASGLVGQELGRGDEPEANRYAWDVLRFSITIYAFASVVVFMFAEPLSWFFAEDPDAVVQTTAFVRIAAASFLASGLAQTLGGILQAAGDNRWIFYGRLVSQYLVLIPLTYIAVVTGIGIGLVLLAILVEASVRASIIGYRVTSGKWMLASRARRPEIADE